MAIWKLKTKMSLMFPNAHKCFTQFGRANHVQLGAWYKNGEIFSRAIN